MKGRVLIIDDEAEIRRNLSVGLMQEDYAVVACPDGISAIHELHDALRKGAGFDVLITDIFMPDIDGLKILRVIKRMFPDLPVLVITGFGDESLRLTALSEHNTGYLDKPFEIPDLTRAIASLTPGRTVLAQGAGAQPEQRESVSAYLTLRITQPDRSLEILNQLSQLEGIQSCEAVYGDIDIVLLGQASSPAGIERLFAAVRAVPGLEIASMSPVERPRLDRDIATFVDIYEREVKRPSHPQPARHTGTTSYIIVDLQPAAIQRVFTTVFFIDEVVFCDVVDAGRKLIGMITGLDTGEQVRKVIDRIHQIEGVLRVRESKVIKIIEG